MDLAIAQLRQDLTGERHQIEDDIWTRYREVIVESDVFDMPAYAALLNEMKSLDQQYDQVLRHTQSYFSETSEFMSRNTFLSNGGVYEILNKERQSEKALSDFMPLIKGAVTVLAEGNSLFEMK